MQQPLTIGLCALILTAATPLTGAAREAAPTLPDVATSAAAPPFASERLADSSLGQVAGREDVGQVSRAEQVAGVSRNTVGDNVTTGEARIDGNAFQNMSGLSILSVNTGNNVAMNAAMNVNVSIQQGP
ncbi:hypothetical protein [Croceibacterium mercuriale]|uniref:hypothetical protein n=1 Tax=Croceibacterium mercuriale TaxID=1572751 RepID=UPI00068BEBBB|nr:hypothetical protein [Croceibacterium mercuriale]